MDVVSPNMFAGSILDLESDTEYEGQFVMTDPDGVKVNVPKLDGRDMKKVQKLYAADYDYRLKPGSPAIDRGVVLPNVIDGYAGKAPDPGAIKLGQEAPHYGPRNSACEKGENF